MAKMKRVAVRGATRWSAALVAAGAVAVGPTASGTLAAQDARATYYVYVAAESADLLHRVRFGPEGAALDQTVVVGEMATETEGPHGLGSLPTDGSST